MKHKSCLRHLFLFLFFSHVLPVFHFHAMEEENDNGHIPTLKSLILWQVALNHNFFNEKNPQALQKAIYETLIAKKIFTSTNYISKQEKAIKKILGPNYQYEHMRSIIHKITFFYKFNIKKDTEDTKAQAYLFSRYIHCSKEIVDIFSTFLSPVKKRIVVAIPDKDIKKNIRKNIIEELNSSHKIASSTFSNYTYAIRELFFIKQSRHGLCKKYYDTDQAEHSIQKKKTKKKHAIKCLIEMLFRGIRTEEQQKILSLAAINKDKNILEIFKKITDFNYLKNKHIMLPDKTVSSHSQDDEKIIFKESDQLINDIFEKLDFSVVVNLWKKNPLIISPFIYKFDKIIPQLKTLDCSLIEYCEKVLQVAILTYSSHKLTTTAIFLYYPNLRYNNELTKKLIRNILTDDYNYYAAAIINHTRRCDYFSSLLHLLLVRNFDCKRFKNTLLKENQYNKLQKNEYGRDLALESLTKHAFVRCIEINKYKDAIGLVIFFYTRIKINNPWYIYTENLVEAFGLYAKKSTYKNIEKLLKKHESFLISDEYTFNKITKEIFVKNMRLLPNGFAKFLQKYRQYIQINTALNIILEATKEENIINYLVTNNSYYEKVQNLITCYDNPVITKDKEDMEDYKDVINRIKNQCSWTKMMPLETKEQTCDISAYPKIPTSLKL